MAYKEVNPTEWTYENDGDFIEGIFTRMQQNIGVNKANLYSVETQENVKTIWGSMILDSKMASIKAGDKIKITYQGLGESKGGKQPPKLFKVEVDRD